MGAPAPKPNTRSKRWKIKFPTDNMEVSKKNSSLLACGKQKSGIESLLEEERVSVSINKNLRGTVPEKHKSI